MSAFLINRHIFISLVYLVLISCSAEVTTTVPETTTISIPEATTTTLSKDVPFQNFKIAWEKNLKESRYF